MALADYAHWNEEAEQVWWQEEGRHAEEPPEQDDDDRFSDRDAADDFCDEMSEHTTDELRAMLDDDEYCARWPQAAKLLRNIIEDRGDE